jgi:fumarate hydratase class II
MAGSHGHFELNVFKPLIIHNILQSIEIMSDSAKTFALYCVKGIKADKKRIKYLLDNSLMLVTALAPKIGYDKAAQIAKNAHKNGTTLRQEVVRSKILSEKEYDKVMNPMSMTKPK